MKGIDQVLRDMESYPHTTLVAITKTVTADKVRRAYEHGVRNFGENRVQDALPKVAETNLPVNWHFVGRLQNNKVRKVPGVFALIHSLDNSKLAMEMESVGKNSGSVFECLVQVNASGEETKQGLSIPDVPLFLEQTRDLNHLRISGLMTMAPLSDDKEEIRSVFRRVRVLYEELGKLSWPHVCMRHLSMGMSSDYRVALAEGANMIRVGSAIFSDL